MYLSGVIENGNESEKEHKMKKKPTIPNPGLPVFTYTVVSFYCHGQLVSFLKRVKDGR